MVDSVEVKDGDPSSCCVVLNHSDSVVESTRVDTDIAVGLFPEVVVNEIEGVDEHTELRPGQHGNESTLAVSHILLHLHTKDELFGPNDVITIIESS